MILLLQLGDVNIISDPQPLILRLLDYMWAFMQVIKNITVMAKTLTKRDEMS